MSTTATAKSALWVILAAALLFQGGGGVRCGKNGPSVQQTQVGYGAKPKFRVEVRNNCPMCPVIDVHLKCNGFSQALIPPKLLKLIAPNDCVVNGGLPLGPSQRLAFAYSHTPPISFSPLSWSLQCE
ncbi:hypothetical protein AMTRI_Chr06g175050 [Amborella trichopoda]